MIYGITGTFGAGKGTIVEHLQKRGVHHYSVSGWLSEELVRRSRPVNRDEMIELANTLRAEHSPSYFVEMLYDLAKKKGGDSVIESIRTTGEAEALKGKESFLLLSVDADREIRYQRIRKRNGPKDQISFEKFIEQENAEMQSADPTKQNIGGVMKLADIHIDNNGTFDELYVQVEEALQ